MIDFLTTLVSPQFGAVGLSRIMELFVPSAQALILALLAARFSFAGLEAIQPDSSLPETMGEIGALVVRAIILLLVLGSWSFFAGLLLSQGPELAARAMGTTASPDAIAGKMVALVARFSDAPVFGVKSWVTRSTLEAAEASGTSAPALSDIGVMMVSFIAIVVAQIIAAAIVVMIAMPKLLLLVCLAIGPFAVAAMMSESRLAEEFSEGWAETTATALLALPVMAILASFLSSIPLPDPQIVGTIGVTGQKGVDLMSLLADDIATYLVIGQLMFMVLPISSGLIQGRMPSVASFMGLIISVLTFIIKPARLLMVKSFGYAIGKARGG